MWTVQKKSCKSIKQLYKEATKNIHHRLWPTPWTLPIDLLDRLSKTFFLNGTKNTLFLVDLLSIWVEVSVADHFQMNPSKNAIIMMNVYDGFINDFFPILMFPKLLRTNLPVTNVLVNGVSETEQGKFSVQSRWITAQAIAI